MPALIAGTGLGILPEFSCARLSHPTCSSDCYPIGPSRSALFIGPPLKGPLPKRVEVLGEYLNEKLSETAAKMIVCSPQRATR